MSKKHDETLFNLTLETEDLNVSEEVSLKVPLTQGTVKTQTEKSAAPQTIHEVMLNGEMPSLLAVDIQDGEVPKQNTIAQETGTETVVAPVIEKPVEKPIEKPAKPAVTEKTEPGKPPVIIDQGQQGGKNIEEENKSPWYLHAAALRQEGVLPNLVLDDLKDLDSTAIVKKIMDASRKQVSDEVETLNNAYRNQFNDPQKQVMEMLEKGIPFDDASNIIYNQQRYNNLTDTQIKESPDVQEKVYREFLYVKGHNQDYIDRAVKQSIDLERLDADSSEAITELKQMAKDEEANITLEADSQAKQKKINNDQVLEKIKTDVLATEHIFEGVVLTPEDQTAILNFMTVPAAEINRGGRKISISKKDEVRRKNPMEFEKRLAYFIHLGLFDENPTIPELVDAGETRATKKLADVLEKGTAPGTTGKPVISKKDETLAAGHEDETPEIRLPESIISVRHNE